MSDFMQLFTFCGLLDFNYLMQFPTDSVIGFDFTADPSIITVVLCVAAGRMGSVIIWAIKISLISDSFESDRYFYILVLIFV